MSNILTFVLRNSMGDSTNNGLTSREDSIVLHHGPDADLADLTLIPDDELVLENETKITYYYKKFIPYDKRK